MYYITDKYTDEIIDVSNDLQNAIDIAKKHTDSEVTDDDDNYFFSNDGGIKQ